MSDDFNGPNGSKHPLKFGLFLPPMHPTGQNPTLTLQRDLKLAEHLDELGFDEFWVGEHHSSGFETIASPEVFIAAAAERTSRIKLGTGVNSLPYHHPLILADRILMLDHLTRGRMMFGVGPGQLASDASMLGIVVDEQRRMMEEAFDVIMALFRGEVVTAETDWFKVIEGRLQLRPYSKFDVAVAASISPSGPRLAGRHGSGLLSVAATNPAGFENLAGHWKVMEEQAAEHGHVVDRGKWRMMGPMHIAETEAQALADCRYGLERVMDYLGHVIPTEPTEATDYEGRVKEMNETGAGVVGTPDMAIAQIQRLIDQSGGFGTYLVFGGDLADWPATLRSYELFAQYVMPHFQDQLAPPQESYDWIVGTDHRFVLQTLHAIDKSRFEYADERGEDRPDALLPEG
ncbi:MAG: LLM class flavin-dependent oxidoreductase [Desertimonas sp.]